MVRIEHIAVWTDDIDRLAGFYAQYLGASIGARYTNPAKGFESRFLTFDGGARLELMRSTTLQLGVHAPGTQGMGLTHLALSVGSDHRVGELTEQLRNAGYRVIDGPRHTGDGYYESVVLDPDGNRLELTGQVCDPRMQADEGRSDNAGGSRNQILGQ